MESIVEWTHHFVLAFVATAVIACGALAARLADRPRSERKWLPWAALIAGGVIGMVGLHLAEGR